MKNLFMIIAALLYTTVAASTIEYSEKLSDGQMKSAAKADTDSENRLRNYGAPSVPFMSYRFLIPFGEKVNDIKVELNGFKTLDKDIEIDCAQPLHMSANTNSFYGLSLSLINYQSID
jgi:hypothetical protein